MKPVNYRSGLHIDASGRCYLIGPENHERLGAASTQAARIPLGDLQQVHYHVVSPGSQIAMAGNLEHFDNAFEIISFIGSTKRSGTLELWSDRARFRLQFSEGALSSASTTDRGDRIGQILHRRGCITTPTLARERQRALTCQRPLGNHLLDEQIITKEQLLAALEQQVNDITLSILLLEKGDFIFSVTHAAQSNQPFELDVNHVLMDSLRRMDEIGAMQARLDEQPWGRLCFRKSANHTAVSDTDTVRNDVLQTLSTPVRFEELCERVAHSKRVVLETLWGLFGDRIVQFAEPTVAPASIAPAAAVTVPPRAGGPASEPDALAEFRDLLRQLHLTLKRLGESHALPRALDRFQQFYGYTSLFRGVRIDSFGNLDLKSLKINLEAVDSRPNAVVYAARALDEFVAFVILALRARLSAQDRKRYLARSKQILKTATR
ncbi:MAG: DUF4388 domain-containing protein [Bradymonadia bacterium]